MRYSITRANPLSSSLAIAPRPKKKCRNSLCSMKGFHSSRHELIHVGIDISQPPNLLHKQISATIHFVSLALSMERHLPCGDCPHQWTCSCHWGAMTQAIPPMAGKVVFIGLTLVLGGGFIICIVWWWRILGFTLRLKHGCRRLGDFLSIDIWTASFSSEQGLLALPFGNSSALTSLLFQLTSSLVDMVK